MCLELVINQVPDNLLFVYVSFGLKVGLVQEVCKVILRKLNVLEDKVITSKNLFKFSPQNDTTEVEKGVLYWVFWRFAVLSVKIYHRGNDVLPWIIIHQCSAIKFYDQFFVQILLQFSRLNYVCKTELFYNRIVHEILNLKNGRNDLSKLQLKDGLDVDHENSLPVNEILLASHVREHPCACLGISS